MTKSGILVIWSNTERMRNKTNSKYFIYWFFCYYKVITQDKHIFSIKFTNHCKIVLTSITDWCRRVDSFTDSPLGLTRHHFLPSFPLVSCVCCLLIARHGNVSKQKVVKCSSSLRFPPRPRDTVKVSCAVNERPTAIHSLLPPLRSSSYLQRLKARRVQCQGHRR